MGFPFYTYLEKYIIYFTEKIFQALEGGTIPIYWAIDFPEPEIINKNAGKQIQLQDLKTEDETQRDQQTLHYQLIYNKKII